MVYSLFLVERTDSGKDIGENIFLDSLPRDYGVYLFYYGGPIRNHGLETKLRELGEDMGRNLFVNLAKPNDPKYVKIAKKFEIRSRPCIIVTAQEDLASEEVLDKPATAFVKLEDKNLLSDSTKTIEIVDQLYHLFASGRIREAMNQAKNAQSATSLGGFKSAMTNVLKKTAKSVEEVELGLSVLDGVKLRVKMR